MSCPTVLVTSDGDENSTPRLLPRLRHWQHDVAIHSQYCISLAFCEKVAANLSPQSSRLSVWRRKQQKFGMKGIGCEPSPSHSVQLVCRLPPPSASTSQRLSGWCLFLCVEIKQLLVSLLLPVCVLWWLWEPFFMQTHRFYPLAGVLLLEVGRGVEWQPDGSHNETVIERYVIITISKLWKNSIRETFLYEREGEEKVKKGGSFN